MNDVAEQVAETSGVADVWQAGGRLYVQLHEDNDYLISSIEENFGMTADTVRPAGTKRYDRGRLEHKEVEFKN